MLALFEGPDGGGKTTAARALAGAAFAYQHNGPPVFDADATDAAKRAQIFWWQLKALVPREHGAAGTIIDRSWPSEQVYHQFAGRPDTFDPLTHRMFERFMLAHNGVVVMCLPKYATAHANWERRVRAGEELVTDVADYATMYEHYRDWTTTLPHVYFDYERESVGDLTKMLVAAGEATYDNPDPGTIYGNPGARILVVGEQYNHVANSADGPFVPFAGAGTNGRWLANQLELMALTEADLAWVNARTPVTGHATDLAVLGRLPHVSAILALGNVAQRWAAEAMHYARLKRGHAYKLFSAPHPAYWTRFHADESWPGLQFAAELGALT